MGSENTNMKMATFLKAIFSKIKNGDMAATTLLKAES